MRAFIFAIFLVLLDLPLAAAQGTDVCAALRAKSQNDAREDALRQLERVGCLGGEKDTDAAAAQVQQILDAAAKANGQAVARGDVQLPPDERTATVRRMLARIVAYLEQVSAAANEDDRAELRAMQRALAAADLAIAGGDSSATVVEPRQWGLARSTTRLGIAAAEIDLLPLLKRAECDGRPTGPRCVAAVTVAEGAVRAATLTERALTVKADESLVAAYRDARRRDQRWKSYFADVKSQFIWENFVNGQIYQRSVRGKGLSDPPTSQLIILHPNVGLEYVGGAAAGDRMRAALVLELIGYNRWSWGEDNKPKNAWGASLVLAYADRAGVRSTAFGVSVIAMNNYALTLTRRGGKTGVMLSVDLTKKVTEADEELKQTFRLAR